MEQLKGTLPGHTPPYARYDPPMNALRPMRRETVSLPPNGPSEITNPQQGIITRFVIPSQGYLAPARTALRFSLDLGVDASTVDYVLCMPVSGAHCLIDSFRVIVAGHIAEHVTNYSDLIALYDLQADGDLITSLGWREGKFMSRTYSSQGIASQAAMGDTRAVGATNAGPLPSMDLEEPRVQSYCKCPKREMDFSLPLLSGLFGPSASDLLPLWAMGALELEITWTDVARKFFMLDYDVNSSPKKPEVGVAANGVVPVIKNLSLEVDIIHMPETYTKDLQQQLSAGQQVKLSYITHESIKQVLKGQSNVVNIPNQLTDVRSIWAVRQKANKALNPVDNRFFGDKFKSAQLQIGSMLFPNKPLQNKTEVFEHWLGSHGRNHSTESLNLDFKSYMGEEKEATEKQAFVMGWDLEKYLADRVLTGIATDQNTSILFDYTGAPHTFLAGSNEVSNGLGANSADDYNETMTVFLAHSRILIIGKGGALVLR